MLYVVYGTDDRKVRASAQRIVARLVEKRPDAALVRLDADTFRADALEEGIGTQGLFMSKLIVVLDHIFATADMRDVFLARLADVAASPNVLVLVEGKIDAATTKKLTAKAEKMQVYDAATPGRPEWNVFGLSDALLARNKKDLWLEYREAKRRGLSEEEMHGTLFFAVKSMLLAGGASSAPDAGLKPFVYGKAKRGAGKYTRDELERMAQELVALYHEAHLGERDFEIGLEQFVLGI